MMNGSPRQTSSLIANRRQSPYYYGIVDDSPYEMDALRSFYAYSNFQPQRIRRTRRTIRSVDPIKWSHSNGHNNNNNQKGATISLGARVISGLEITM